MLSSIKLAGVCALLASATPQGIHFDINLDGSEQVRLQSPNDPFTPFAAGDVVAMDSCCCPGSDSTKGDTQCPALSGQTQMLAGRPTTFYCTGHRAGTLIKSDKQPTLQACAAAGVAVSGCFSIDYDKVTGECWYYKEGDGPTQMNSKYDSAVVAPIDAAYCTNLGGNTRNVAGRTATYYCNKQITGNLLLMNKQASLLECSIACAKTDGCNSGDFQSASLSCYMYTSGGNSPPATASGVNCFTLSNTRCETLA